MRDFEVANTHNFIFKNGLITHNCEDYALAIACVRKSQNCDDLHFVVTGTGYTPEHFVTYDGDRNTVYGSDGIYEDTTPEAYLAETRYDWKIQRPVSTLS